ncbi:MAG TPA: 50S ribosomal protein L24 [Thermoanaerobaculia bacterium]|nr:50S ribosomal protein L24 [Thermoanaerobaculia bacterium]
MKKLKIKKGDRVLVISGRDRGTTGKVLRVLPERNRAIVEGVNMIKRHTRPNPQRQVQGGILEREAPIAVPNLMLLCPETGKPTRVGRKRLEDGRGVRVSKKSGSVIS